MGFAPLIERHHGVAGGVALRAIMRALRQIYSQYQPMNDSHRLVVFQLMPVESYEISGSASKLHDISDLLTWVGGPIAIQLETDDTLWVWPSLKMADLSELSHHAVVYSFEGQNEYFWAGGERDRIPRIVPGIPSLFAVPTFTAVRDALNRYRSTAVRVCQCEILKSAWYDSNRLFFRAKPEWLMRRSLVQYLRASLRSASEVAPEQNVDESHPIDIKVTFEGAQHVALIEIKWLGKSRHEEDGSIASTYFAKRSRDGAKQLADYLDMFHGSAPLKQTRGYLVTIDGRRRRLTATSTSITHTDGMHYDHQEISFTTKYHELRNDFEEPVRMFAEPVCS